ncbi:DVU_1553 family AMP-dependent CoA ligase [Oryzibacter oryziterrae]|uniref:DVU_1553 family AMP-dependent CoA ligase n=1 Tax=Oryzibacter oryziterrae TaxID=2766474 RepID=UPI001F294875|nr:AMP-binding protein [Oryzibacter oryziterrae]
MSLDAWTAATLSLSSPLSAEALQAAQLHLLNDTIAFARQASPFYRRLALPDVPLARISDLAQLPFTTPEDLTRADPPLTAVSQSQIARIVTLPTSGTTGAPKRLHFSEADVDAIIAYFAAGMGQFTRAGDTVVIAFPGERPGSIGDNLVAAMARLGARAVLVPWTLPPEDLGRLIEAERADVVAGPPVRMLAAARCHRPTTHRVRAALLSSDRLPPPLKQALEDIWGAEVFDHWGMTETGLGGAVECSVHDGMHLRAPDIHAEIVDPQTGAPCPDNTPGELVITTLRRRGQPLIRYRTGDRARLDTAPCACGSILPRLVVEGRLDAGIDMPSGRLTLATLDDILFADAAVTDFTADWSKGAPPVLDICLATASLHHATDIVPRCRQRLQASPLIGPELATDRLRITVRLNAEPLCQHNGKRRLTQA